MDSQIKAETPEGPPEAGPATRPWGPARAAWESHLRDLGSNLTLPVSGSFLQASVLFALLLTPPAPPHTVSQYLFPHSAPHPHPGRREVEEVRRREPDKVTAWGWG